MLYIPVKHLAADAITPTKNDAHDAAYDLYMRKCDLHVIPPGDSGVFRVYTGIAIAIPDGYFGHILPRSGLAVRYGLHVLGGVIDSGYRGELVLVLQAFSKEPVIFKGGDKVAQIVFHRTHEAKFTVCDDLPPSTRGEQGFGSSDYPQVSGTHYAG